MSSYQDFIVNTLKNTASKTEVEQAVNSIQERLSGIESSINDLTTRLVNVEKESNNIQTVFRNINIDELKQNYSNILNNAYYISEIYNIWYYELIDNKYYFRIYYQYTVTADESTGYFNGIFTFESTTNNWEYIQIGIPASIDSNGLPSDDGYNYVNLYFNENPVINLVGDSIISITQGSTYNDAGAIATDKVDGDITSSIVVGGHSFDTSLAGDYIITYNVTDSDNHSSTEVTRLVRVLEPVVGSPASLFTWANSGQVEIVKLREEYTENFKSNDQNKTLVFGASSFNVSMDALDIYNYDTSKLLTVGDFYDININGTDFKLKIHRVLINISNLPYNVIIQDTGATFFEFESSISQSYKRIFFGGIWIDNFYKITGAEYITDSIYIHNFAATKSSTENNYYEVEYILSHKTESSQNITLTFQLNNNGIIQHIKHTSFTFDSNYYSFDNDGNFELNTMTFVNARRYISGSWNENDLLGSSSDINTYGVSVSSKSGWSLVYGKVVNSLIDFNGYNQLEEFGSNALNAEGLKLKENVLIQGYIESKEHIILYDSTKTNPIETMDFTFTQIDLNDNYKLTNVTQSSSLPSSGFKLYTHQNNQTIVTLDSTITYTIDNVDVTNDDIRFDVVTDITDNDFLTSV